MSKKRGKWAEGTGQGVPGLVEQGSRQGGKIMSNDCAILEVLEPRLLLDAALPSLVPGTPVLDARRSCRSEEDR